MEQNSTMQTIFVVILVIIGSIIVNGLTSGLTNLTSVTNESFAVTAPSNGSTITLANHPMDGTALVIKNGTGAITLSTPQNYTYVASTGVITLNTTEWGNISTVGLADWRATYQYQPSGYISPTSINGIILPYLSTFLLLGVLALLAYTRFG